MRACLGGNSLAGNYDICILCGQSLRKKCPATVACDVRLVQSEYFADECPQLESCLATGKRKHVHFCSEECAGSVRMPELDSSVAYQLCQDMIARFAIQRLRWTQGRCRAEALARCLASGDISVEQSQVLRSAGHFGKTMCSPHMSMDPICVEWIAILRTCCTWPEVVFLATVLVLFASPEALAAMKRESLLHLREDDTWPARFTALTTSIPAFFKTITRRGGEHADKASKVSGVLNLRVYLLRQQTLGAEPPAKKDLVRVIQSQVNNCRQSDSALSFGEFKSYVAAKVIGYVNSDLFNVATPPKTFSSKFLTEDVLFARASLVTYVLEKYRVYVGPHSLCHLQRAFRCQSLSGRRAKRLLAVLPGRI